MRSRKGPRHITAREGFDHAGLLATNDIPKVETRVPGGSGWVWWTTFTALACLAFVLVAVLAGGQFLLALDRRWGTDSVLRAVGGWIAAAAVLFVLAVVVTLHAYDVDRVLVLGKLAGFVLFAAVAGGAVLGALIGLLISSGRLRSY